MSLEEIIIDRINRGGPMSFRDFMEMALYHPGLGYYNAPHQKIGKEGDFYTSPSLTPVFGAMIGRQIEQMWTTVGEQKFSIIEYGAGTGLLCADILNYLRQNQPFYDQLSYCIIEKGSSMRELQKKRLGDKVSWYENLSELADVTGCILSNELIDNLAVHQVVMEDELMEVFVEHQNEFVEVLYPASQELKNYFEELQVPLPKGFRAEVNLEAIKWIQDIARSLKCGYVITVDYGYSSAELYKPSHSRGTILCYSGHRVDEDPYHFIGQKDITAHVNFSALSHWGSKSGLHTCGLTSQAEFLLRLGYRDYLLKTTQPGANIAAAARQIAYLNHTLLVDMGRKFKVLVQKKGIEKEIELQGLGTKC